MSNDHQLSLLPRRPLIVLALTPVDKFPIIPIDAIQKPQAIQWQLHLILPDQLDHSILDVPIQGVLTLIEQHLRLIYAKPEEHFYLVIRHCYLLNTLILLYLFLYQDRCLMGDLAG